MLNDLKAWQAQRHAELSAPDSWLGMIGLFWLSPGVNQVGCHEGAAIQLPDGPEKLGDVIWQGDTLLWQPVVGAAQSLRTDLAGPPTVIDHQNLSFFVVDRDGQLAVRLRDRTWAASRPFGGLAYFDEDPAWCITADWLELSPPLDMAVPNVSGDLKPLTVTHKAVFLVAGQPVELLPMSVGEQEVFFVFRDRTSGKSSYGAGRFLKTKPAVDGKICLDFNYAYNPPCAFTAFATCPLPPAENWLGFPVAAGEQKPVDRHD